MRVLIHRSFFNITLLSAIVIVSGCVVTVSTLPNSWTKVEVGKGSPTSIPRPSPQPPTVKVDSNTNAVFDCSKYPLPLKDKRPHIRDFSLADVSDREGLNQALIKFIKLQDAYITAHQEREQKIYDAWYRKCSKRLQEPSQ